ncbi:UDP-glucose 4-epimerase [Sulfuriferula plumbiphila]|uniref:UDP-glucose 4-epimerase n=1 Tax=Sulfuriferula plumbiphila TaxID=171865 RepID=A0A512L796_9PROT|nr:UDP-glucose 4-epimerase GalE [Sulfuriferula plumbiphila]BBP03620.1 UDP-glucose 4-epimerase [Sulfuriferula plumbiphila]GEP30021.1 UDP-glucose 4-epimerase [Sulfuriferula plumbiphila]
MTIHSILVTGGAGYIGSHTCVALIEAGYVPLVLDNLSNSNPAVLGRVQRITGTRPQFIEGDVRDGALLTRVFAEHSVAAVIHFAGLKAVGESVQQPLAYYDNNVHGTLSLLQAMHGARVNKLIFSSSATVYGDPASVPICEDFPRSATNPYGRSKLIIEDVLADLHYAQPDWHIARLRYFNPVGAHASGLIGEDPQGIPNNLMPYITQVAIGRLDKLRIFGGDWPTPDGTGVRDYIHVMDLAEGHVAALAHLLQQPGMFTVNLGSGQGYSVLQMVQAFSRACARELPYEIVERRPGDIAACWADPGAAQALLGWCARRGLEDICIDAWRWQQGNPVGFARG